MYFSRIIPVMYFSAGLDLVLEEKAGGRGAMREHVRQSRRDGMAEEQRGPLAMFRQL